MAAIICGILLAGRSSDRYLMTFGQADFRKVYLTDYTGGSTTLLEHVPEAEGSVLCYTKGPLSLSPADYAIDFQYVAGDDSSVLKLYATDYVSADNSGGAVLLQQKIDPDTENIRVEFKLDQRVDSLYIQMETQDTQLQIGRITMGSSAAVFTDTWFFIAVTLLLALAALYLLNMKKTGVQPASLAPYEISAVKTAQMFVFLMAAAVFAASIPLLNEGLPVGHDLPFHMARIEGIASGLQSGQFPVRVHGETLNGYGYPNSLFYPELLLYVPAFLRLLGVSTFTCYKFYMVMVHTLTVVLSYVAFKKFTGSRFIGMIASIIYLLAPYRLVCAYYRSAIGEFTALSFLPLALYGLYAVLYGSKKDWMYLVAGATGVLQSHILTSEMTVLLAGILCVVGIRRLFGREKRVIQLLYAAVTTLLLNLWMLGPMLLMMGQLGLSVFDRPASVQNWLDMPDGFGYLFTVGSLNASRPYPVGWISLFALGFYLLYRITHKIDEKNEMRCRVGDIFAWLSVVFTIATTSYFPWAIVEKIPVLGTMMGSIQFPYRCLALAQVCFAALAALTLLLWFPQKKALLPAGVLTVCVVAVSTLLFYEFGFVRDGTELIVNKHEYTSYMDSSWSVGQAEYLVEGSNLDAMIADPPVLESNNATLAIDNFERSGTKMRFEYSVDLAQAEQTMIALPVSYIPNYVIKVDGAEIQPVKYAGGRVAFQAPQQQGSVTVAYREPRTFRLFEAVSVLALAACIFWGTGLARRSGFFRRFPNFPKSE